MTDYIEFRFYFDAPRPQPDELLCRMARVLGGTPQVENAFAALTTYRRHRHTRELVSAGGLNAEQLCQEARGKRDPELGLSTNIAFPCWRFGDDDTPERGTVGIELESWGDEWLALHWGDRRVGGEAAVSLMRPSPFLALTKRSKSPQRDAINVKVEENLEELTQLFFRLIEELKPRSVKLYNSASFRFPMNAQLAYFRDESVVLDDLAWIAELWEQGLPSRKMPPLAQTPKEDVRYVFHEWRTSEMHQALRQRLGELVPRYKDVKVEDVQRLIGSGRFDNYTNEIGFTVLEYPHFLNAFVDRFYLELLAGKPL